MRVRTLTGIETLLGSGARFKIFFDAIRELMKPPAKPWLATGFGSAAQPASKTHHP